eukprot:1990295-Rhodomonas_salina.1
MSFIAGNMSLEELMHLRFHVNDEKLVEQSKRVDGGGRVLKRLGHLRGLQCHCCQDAKATLNNYPPAVATWADGPDRWNLDLFDMGEEFPTIHGNCFTTMIVIMKSRFTMIFLHKPEDKKATTVKSILERAFARAG